MGKRVTQEQVNEIHALREKGMTWAQVSKRMKLSQSALVNNARKPVKNIKPVEKAEVVKAPTPKVKATESTQSFDLTLSATHLTISIPRSFIIPKLISELLLR